MNGFVPTLELTGLLGTRQAAGCNVLVAMVCNLVASLMDGATRFGIKIDGESRNEPGGLNVVARKQRQQSLRTHQAKFPSRDRRRTGLSVCKPAGDGIEVESQRDLMLPSRHWNVTCVSLLCSKQYCSEYIIKYDRQYCTRRQRDNPRHENRADDAEIQCADATS